MKKIYLLFLFISISTLTFAQIGFSWWQFLPLDFEENPYPRQTIMVSKVSDDVITDANSLEELWGTVNDDFKYGIEGLVTGGSVMDFSSGSGVETDIPDQIPSDYTGSYTLMAGDDALYVLYHVIDDEVLPTGGDAIELAFAPYAEKYDPGRTIFPDMRGSVAGHWWPDSMSYVWGWDTSTGLPSEGAVIIPAADYIEMAKYGSWQEAGAYKVDLSLVSSAEVFAPAPVYSMKGDNLDILGDVRGGIIPIPMQTLFESTADGYLFLALIPWELMANQKLENMGDRMSIAPKVNDFDNDNFSFQKENGAMITHRYDYWGSTDNNDVYWAIAFYGAIAELAVTSSNFEPLNNVIKAYYTDQSLVITNSQGNHTVDIYNLNGVLIKTIESDNVMNLSSLHAGYYIADIRDTAGNRSLVKFVKAAY